MKNFELNEMGLKELSIRELKEENGGSHLWNFGMFVLACATAGTGVGAAVVGAVAIGTIVYHAWQSDL